MATISPLNCSQEIVIDPEQNLVNRFDRVEQRVRIIESHSIEKAKQKAWESSNCRTSAIALLTYIAATGILFLIPTRPYLGSLVPTAGWLISRPTLSFCRSIWEKYFYKPEKEPFISEMV